MTVTPNGAPSWVRNSDFETYGGHANKANYQNQGVVNPRTDVGAEAIARLASDLAAVMRTLAFAVFTVECNDTVPAAPTVTVAFMQTGVATVSYEGDAPPTGFPAFARTGNGQFTITFESTYDDPYGVAGAFGITHAEACLHGTAAGSEAVDYTAGGVVLTVSFFVSAGTAKSDATGTVEVW